MVAHSADGQIDTMLQNELQRQEKEIRGLEQQNLLLQERLAKLEIALASISAER